MYHNFLIHSSADGHLRLLPCPGYYKQCCDEHWGTCVSFNSGFLRVYAQQWDHWVIWQFYFQFFWGISTLFSIVAALVCIPTNSVRGFPFLCTFSSIHCRHFEYHFFFIHSSVDGHLGCFLVLAIVNTASVNMGVHVSLSILVSSGCMPSNGIAGLCGRLDSVF